MFSARNIRWAVIAALLALLLGCSQEPAEPTYKRPTVFYLRTDFRVEVRPADAPPGPGYLVHLYLSPEEFKRGAPSMSEITDSAGRALFSDVRMGEAYLDCYVPGVKAAYDSSWVEVFGDTNVVYVLNPR